MADYRTLVVVPAKDEEESIGAVLEKMSGTYPNLDILVVDDGSEDGTVRIAKINGVKIISHGGNFGVTAAIQTGRVYALEHDYDFIVFCDADGQHNPMDIGKILSPLVKGEADFVIGSRELGDYECNEPLVLKLPRYFCAVVISLLVRKLITDPTSGFKGWNRAVMEYLREIYETDKRKLHTCTTNDMEEIMLASKKRFRIKEVPVKMFERKSGETKVYVPRISRQILFDFPLDLIRAVLRNLIKLK